MSVPSATAVTTHLGDSTVRLLKKIRGGLQTAWELIVSVWRGPHWWLVPVVLILLPAAALLVFLQTVPIVAPFVYTVF